jgi:chemotaxis protein MotB
MMRLWTVAAPGVPAPTWLLTFTDMVLLLLTFFVLMFAMSKPDPASYPAVAQSYVERFARLPVSDVKPGPACRAD